MTGYDFGWKVPSMCENRAQNKKNNRLISNTNNNNHNHNIFSMFVEDEFRANSFASDVSISDALCAEVL